VISSFSNAELFVDEKEAEAARKAQQEREAAPRIPGMLKPSQRRHSMNLQGNRVSQAARARP